MSDLHAPLLIEFPTPGSDTYLDAAALGKLQREIGETMVDQAGISGAKAALAAAREQDVEPTGPSVA